MRNIKEQRRQAREITKKHRKLDLQYKELEALRDSFMENVNTHGVGNAIFDLTADAYYMGLAVGYRNGKKDSRK